MARHERASAAVASILAASVLIVAAAGAPAPAYAGKRLSSCEAAPGAGLTLAVRGLRALAA